MPERVGFLGLGIMGSRMAACLGRAGFELTVWTHTPGKAESWAQEHGATAAGTPAEVAAASDVVVSMVVDGDQVASVLLGPGGVIEAAGSQLGGRERPEPLCVDMSTIAPADTRRIGAALADHGIAMLDAPVTGSSPRAEQGTLTIMAGGRREHYERALPLLRAMGEVVVHVGELGQGEVLKLVNNGLAAANATALAEALLLARAAGIPPDPMLEVLEAGSGDSTQLRLKARPMLDHDFRTLFKAEHMLKDVLLCLQEADNVGLGSPAVAHAAELLQETVGRGDGERDYAALVESVEERAGRKLQ